MFKKILLPIDLTTRHEPAVRVAADLARPSAGNVVLLHVIEEIHGFDRNDEPEFFARLEQSARTALDKLGQRLNKAGIKWEGRIAYGDRVREVVGFAKKSRSDLIIVTKPQFDNKHPAHSWGSLSWKIGILADCPVLLVK